MIQNKYYRKHPRTHTKNSKEKENEENILNLSAFAAAGILAFSFINGMLLGYMWKKSRC
ncbi:hypothetical protein [Acetivibrio clariflavus]|uniref:Uncharacterized protein n=1 Tax=Acetivibrio clariflavus (strain DSM 19732 / NBRC 101661 / EBR45) TaxID=720554 RepID=G8LZT3_ACECE|nr:hypothetical protein [Acetivibrio clariflavus]AEV69023.1 hypothetical protein Clocl_2448 [Acetivibrio clariflavus DSM 19732]